MRSRVLQRTQTQSAQYEYHQITHAHAHAQIHQQNSVKNWSRQVIKNTTTYNVHGEAIGDTYGRITDSFIIIE